MSVIATIAIGLVVGLVAKLLMPGRDPGGFIITILIGIAGALAAGWVGQGVGWYREGEPAGFGAAVLGAKLLLLLFRLITRRRLLFRLITRRRAAWTRRLFEGGYAPPSRRI